ncbi:tripartite tricarboxylate transporter TctB family protein [Amylibacter sp. IMCC11727]|uniref:tripartite tricarboxylate transporter TctB family protein n=1 Tax=Amylibacter sp. IMCC11727 TaxID=3039851 RepID=UPI00244E1039|nr:tripartite tricarboxylate transporter TctB family protein [Amylibacter sp. IMCC11727]WGI23601.1 tripartite tricarboxylate transporter TctB family protein [Amylibacter sp. IMCC11727]
MLSQLGEQAKFNPKGKFFAQPAVWPGIGVFGMTFFGGLHLFTRYKHRVAGTLGEFFTWVRALEFVGWFMVYVFAVPLIGYLPCTIVFTVTLALRMGYRSGKMLCWAAIAGLAIVVVFKTLLQVKIPGAASYEYLPDALRNFMIVYF